LTKGEFVTVLRGTVEPIRGEWVLHPAPELAGEAGVGKSALLAAAATMASAGGFRVLRADGAQFEAGLSFSALLARIDQIKRDDLYLLRLRTGPDSC
jgi:ABC-type cobalamin transport system ATPase subunit